MVLMNHGKVLAAGSMTELRQRAHKAFRLFVRFQNNSTEAIASLRTLSPRQLKEAGGEYELSRRRQRGPVDPRDGANLGAASPGAS